LVREVRAVPDNKTAPEGSKNHRNRNHCSKNHNL
jgi:hypothetical protein